MTYRILALMGILTLAGCTSVPVATTAYPTELMQDCKTGRKLGLSTNAELSSSVEALASTLKQCNADKAGLRKWVEDQRKP